MSSAQGPHPCRPRHERLGAFDLLELGASVVILSQQEPIIDQMKRTVFTVSDGKMLLTLKPAEEGGFVVTSPMDPELITEAETLEEAFENARDAAKSLKQSRRKLMRTLAQAQSAKK